MLHARIARIDAQNVPRLRAWLASLAARRDELAESYRRHGTRHELFLLVPAEVQPILVVVAEVEDGVAAAVSFLRSELAIDVEFKALVQQVSFEETQVELLYDSARLMPPPRIGVGIEP